MKTKLALLLSTLLFSQSILAAPTHLPKADLARLDWQSVNWSQKITTELSKKQIQQFTKSFSGIDSPVAAYKIPANQGTLKLKISSLVVDEQYIFMPNVLVLDADYNVALHFPASHFQQVEARALSGNQLQAELNLTPTAGQDFIYLLVYTTAEDLKSVTTFTHPAKQFAKAKGTQPPAIADITVKHTDYGKIQLDIDGIQSTQFVGLGSGALFERKQSAAKDSLTIGNVKSEKGTKSQMTLNQPIENSTEKYFNQAVKDALKSNDINKAMNLVNEAEQLGLTSPRKIFLQQVSSK